MQMKYYFNVDSNKRHV